MARSLKMTIENIGPKKELYVATTGERFLRIAEFPVSITLIPGKAKIKAVNTFRSPWKDEKTLDSLWWVYDRDRQIFTRIGQGSGECTLKVPEEAAGAFSLSFGDDGVMDDLCTIEVGKRTVPWEFT